MAARTRAPITVRDTTRSHLSDPSIPESRAGIVDDRLLVSMITRSTRCKGQENAADRFASSRKGNLEAMTSDDALALAAEAGLHYTEAGDRGMRRVRRGKGFSYVDDAGSAVNGLRRKWIEGLVIPPAWADVWISGDPDGHILATGVDKAGRKQYIYHPDWETVRDEAKFERLRDFGKRLPALRRGIDGQLRKKGLDRSKVVALAIAVLDRTLIRVGNRRYADGNESYGLTTLTCDHLEINGSHLHLEFAGKGGAEREVVFQDRRLSSLVQRCQELAGQTLFSYPTPDGSPASVTSTDINRYLANSMGGPFTAKDFRTWGASSLVAGELARHEPGDRDVVLGAIDAAAEHLGNTRAVCRGSYVHPAVLTAHEDGSLQEAWLTSRTGKWMSRSESTLRTVLDTESA